MSVSSIPCSSSSVPFMRPALYMNLRLGCDIARFGAGLLPPSLHEQDDQDDNQNQNNRSTTDVHCASL